MENRNDCFTKEELHRLMCRFSQTQWGRAHTPFAIRIQTVGNTYTSEAGNPQYKQKKG